MSIEDSGQLMSPSAVGGHRERWLSIQAKFVDEPRDSLNEADSLVNAIIEDLTRGFAEQRERLEAQWRMGADVSTEDLRGALQQYRSFFERLLAI